MSVGQPFWGRAITIAVCLALTFFREQRRKERRLGINPYKGINPTRNAITCPRCNAPWPGGYEPRSHREHMWRGVVCPACGCEYDELRREREKD
jgi:hypothetical protein